MAIRGPKHVVLEQINIYIQLLWLAVFLLTLLELVSYFRFHFTDQTVRAVQVAESLFVYNHEKSTSGENAGYLNAAAGGAYSNNLSLKRNKNELNYHHIQRPRYTVRRSVD